MDIKDKWRTMMAGKQGNVKEFKEPELAEPGKRKLYSRWSFAEEEALLAGIEK